MLFLDYPLDFTRCSYFKIMEVANSIDFSTRFETLSSSKQFNKLHSLFTAHSSKSIVSRAVYDLFRNWNNNGDTWLCACSRFSTFRSLVRVAYKRYLSYHFPEFTSGIPMYNPGLLPFNAVRLDFVYGLGGMRDDDRIHVKFTDPVDVIMYGRLGPESTCGKQKRVYSVSLGTTEYGINVNTNSYADPPPYSTLTAYDPFQSHCSLIRLSRVLGYEAYESGIDLDWKPPLFNDWEEIEEYLKVHCYTIKDFIQYDPPGFIVGTANRGICYSDSAYGRKDMQIVLMMQSDVGVCDLITSIHIHMVFIRPSVAYYFALWCLSKLRKITLVKGQSFTCFSDDFNKFMFRTNVGCYYDIYHCCCRVKESMFNPFMCGDDSLIITPYHDFSEITKSISELEIDENLPDEDYEHSS